MMYLQNKKILITGATGFIGSNLLKKLESLGADVSGVSRGGKGKSVEKLNILDFDQINNFIQKNKIEICFHLAGEPLVEKGQNNPYIVLKENYLGSLNILESSRINELDRVIIASSSHVYGENKPPFVESLFPRPSRPYETSKACIDLVAQSYAETYHLPVLIPRFENIYGPGDYNLSRLIPKTMKSVISGKNPEMWGGSTKRQYLYIDDATNAYIKLATLSKKSIQKNRIFNFGGSELISVEEIINKIIKISEKNLKINKIENQRVQEIKNQYVSTERAQKLLNWKPDYDLDSGLTETYKWALKELN